MVKVSSYGERSRKYKNGKQIKSILLKRITSTRDQQLKKILVRTHSPLSLSYVSAHLHEFAKLRKQVEKILNEEFLIKLARIGHWNLHIFDRWTLQYTGRTYRVGMKWQYLFVLNNIERWHISVKHSKYPIFVLIFGIFAIEYLPVRGTKNSLFLAVCLNKSSRFY